MADLVKQWKEAARRNDLFDHMVPSDVRQLIGEIERLREALEPFSDENAWSGWSDHKGAYLTADFRGLGEPWVWAQDALNQSSVSAPLEKG